MTAVHIHLTVQIDGAAAADVAHDLAIDVEAGELDHAAHAMLRSFLAPDARDWKVSSVLADVAVAVPGSAELRRRLAACEGGA